MILAVDIGNTNIVLGCIKDGVISNIMRIETVRKKTEFEYAVLIGQLLLITGVNMSKFDGAVISSVVPPLTAPVRSAVRMVTGCQALVVGAGLKTGLNIGIDDPSQMGTDLVAGAVAALSIHEPPIIIVDMGTATTISVIGPNSRLMGGAIMPGPNISVDALAGSTAQLPRIPIEPPKKCIGSNTIECMKSGAVFGTAAAVDGMIDRMEAELGIPATVVATGSLAKKILPHCRHTIEIDEDLVLRGLWVIWEKNRGSGK